MWEINGCLPGKEKDVKHVMRLETLRKKLHSDRVTIGGLTYEETEWLVVLVYELLPHVTHHHHCALKHKMLGKCTCGLSKVLLKIGPVPAGTPRKP